MLKDLSQRAYSNYETLQNSYDLALLCKDLEGDFVECGVAAGAQVAANRNKNSYLLSKKSLQMKKYSQNNEQDIILKYFDGQQLGTYLDIGAYDPEVFSNTRALYEIGWRGVLVEPAEMNYNVLKEYFKKDNATQIIQTCVGTFDGVIEFFDSGGDAIGTTIASHAKKWADGYGTKYKTVKSRIVTFKTLREESIYKKFDFINIDVEEMDFQVLSQIPLNEVGCRLVCVEFNGKDKDKYHGLFHRQQFRHVFSNGENLIYGK